MTVPEGYARYAVIDGFGPGGAKLTILAETAPAGAFQVDELPAGWDPKPPPGTRATIRIGAKQAGSGRIRLLFNGNDYSEPLPVQVPPGQRRNRWLAEGRLPTQQPGADQGQRTAGATKERHDCDEWRHVLPGKLG